MEKKLQKRRKVLTLNKETLRVLQAQELSRAVGGIRTAGPPTCSFGLCCPEN